VGLALNLLAFSGGFGGLGVIILIFLLRSAKIFRAFAPWDLVNQIKCPALRIASATSKLAVRV
jgi:hypothetical protein